MSINVSINVVKLYNMSAKSRLFGIKKSISVNKCSRCKVSNRRVGDFLKELQLREGRATGFPKIYKAM